MKNTSISEKQKQIIGLMKKRRFIFKNVSYAIISGCDISLATVHALHNKGIISIPNRRDKSGFWVCKLTIYGKSISLNK